MEGRVEVCDNFYRWGTVCNKQWTSAHTKVTCRNLGYRADESKIHDCIYDILRSINRTANLFQCI